MQRKGKEEIDAPRDALWNGTANADVAGNVTRRKVGSDSKNKVSSFIREIL